MSGFNTEDYLQLKSEMDYLIYIIDSLDTNDLAQAAEKVALMERLEMLEELLNKWRALERRKGFTVIEGGKA